MDSRTRLRGFSLVELAIVVAIVGVLSGIALGVGSDTVRTARAREEKEAVRTLLVQARNHARRSGACVKVTRASPTLLTAALFVDASCAAAPHAVPPSPAALTLKLLVASEFTDGSTTSPSLLFLPSGSIQANGPQRLTLTPTTASTPSTLQVWPAAGIVSEEHG